MRMAAFVQENVRNNSTQLAELKRLSRQESKQYFPWQIYVLHYLECQANFDDYWPWDAQCKAGHGKTELTKAHHFSKTPPPPFPPQFFT